MAEDVHKQGVGARGAIELATGAGSIRIVAAGDAGFSAIGFVEAGGPVGVGLDGAVGRREEVAVLTLVGLKLVMLEEDAGDGAVGNFMRVLTGVTQAAGAQFASEG